MTALTVDKESRRSLDALLAECAQQVSTPRYTLPQMLGDYQAVPGKSGWYVLPMCLEIELRALEFVNQIRTEEQSVMTLMRTAIDLAAVLLYRVELPNDPEAASDKLKGYLRGQCEILRPATTQEIGRAFKSSEELIDLVLKPLGLWSEATPEGEAKNE